MPKQCEICASSVKVEKHRIIPGLKYGGKYTSDNIILLCRRCHNLVHKLIKIETKRGRLNELLFQDFIEAVRELIN